MWHLTSRWQTVSLIVLLWLMVMATAIAVVNVTHASRLKLNQLEQLRRESNQLQVIWGQLLLEQGTWADYSRVEKLAQKKLNMKSPQIDEMVIVK